MLAPFLGSGSTLRGFANRRFTDRNRAAADAANTAGGRRAISTWRCSSMPARWRRIARISTSDDFETAWGIGARFHGPHFNAFRIEVARGREGLRIIFAGSQAF